MPAGVPALLKLGKKGDIIPNVPDSLFLHLEALPVKQKGRGLLRVPLVLVKSITLVNGTAGLLDRPRRLDIDT